MPTYDYKCDACGHTFEQVQSIKADSLKKCPECGKQKLRRLIGA
jgi:putative FmdB family regulatory protein